MADGRLGLTGDGQLRWGLGRRLQEIWNGEDGRRNRSAAETAGRLRGFTEEVTALLDGLNPRPLTPALLSLRVNKLAADETLAVLEELAPAGSAAEATVPAAVAAGVRLARNSHGTTPAQRDADRAAARPALLALARDEGLPAPVRVGFLGALLDGREELGADGLTAAAMTLLVETLGDRDAPLDTDSVDALFAAYNALDPVPEDAPDAATLVTAYIEAIARPRRSSDDGLTVRLPGVVEVAEDGHAHAPRAALLSLELALRHGLHNDADRLLAADRGELATCPAAWLSLLRHGRAERAADAIRARYADARPVSPAGFGFTEEDASRLPELLAFFPEDSDAGLRLFAEAALASLPVATDDGPERPLLAPLVGRFDAGLFSSSRLRDATLLMLAQDPEAAIALGPALADATANASIVATASADDEDEPSWVTRELKLAAVMAKLHRGDTAEAIAASDALHVDPGNRDNGQYEFHRQLNRLALVTDRARDHGDWDLDRLTALRPVYESLLVPKGFWSSLDHTQPRIAVVMVLNALDPDRGPEDFHAWFDAAAAKNEEGRHSDFELPGFQVVRGEMKQLAHRDEAPIEDRVRMIRGALGMGLEMNRKNLFHYFIAFDEILTPDELAAHGEEMAEPLGGLGLISAASALANRDHPGADAAWGRAVAALKRPDAEPADRVLLVMRLVKNGRPAEAAALAEGFAPEDPGLRKQLDAALQKAAEPEPEPEPEAVEVPLAALR